VHRRSNIASPLGAFFHLYWIRGLSDTLWMLAGVVALLLSVLVNLVSYVPPLQDFNDWVYQAYLIVRLSVGEVVPAVPKYWPVPNAFSQLSLALMMTIMTPITSARTFACLYLAVGGGVMLWLSRRSNGTIDGLRFLLLVCIGVVNAPYWSGEINYQIGLMFLACFLGINRHGRYSSVFTDILYSLILFACHAICLGIFFIYVGWRSLLRGRISYGVISIFPASVLLVWYVLSDPRPDYDPANALSVGPHLAGSVEWIAYRLYSFTKIGPYQNLLFGASSDYERCKVLYLAGIVVNIIFAGAMIMFLTTWVTRSVKGSQITPELLTAVSCVFIAIVNPALALGVGNAGERFIYPAFIIVAIFFDGPSRWSQLGGVAGGFLLVFLTYQVSIVPRNATLRGDPGWSEMNRPEVRFRILFWHRPFLYLPQLDAAQEAAVLGTTPTIDIVYQTSVLRHKPAEIPP
jgi:hypothetical protein